MRRYRCGKRRYRHWAQAQKALLKVQERFVGPPHKKPKRAYRCERCHGFHLTSKEFGY
jgi:hypothetical protein